MLDFLPAALERYIADHSTPAPALFSELAEDTRRNTDSAQMLVGPVQGLLLKLLARAIDARRVLEIGTFTGYSALMLAEGVTHDGEVITCDTSEEYTAIARRYWAKSPHGKKVTLRLGRALDLLDGIDGPFDLVFIDADKENYIAYWDACLPKLRRGGIILADNVLWSGRVLDPKEPSDRAVAAFNHHVRNDARVESVMLSIRDGLTMAYKL
jgi:caffeoyl-CoA O-methyltransferase